MEIKYDIVTALGVVSEKADKYGNRWAREVNLVSWNGGEPKVDIREWNSDHTKMSKGITLKPEEAETVAMILHNYMRERSK